MRPSVKNALYKGILWANVPVYAFNHGVAFIHMFHLDNPTVSLLSFVVAAVMIGAAWTRLEDVLADRTLRSVLPLVIALLGFGPMLASTWITNELSPVEFVLAFASTLLMWQQTHAWRVCREAIA